MSLFTTVSPRHEISKCQRKGCPGFVGLKMGHGALGEKKKGICNSIGWEEIFFPKLIHKFKAISIKISEELVGQNYPTKYLKK